MRIAGGTARVLLVLAACAGASPRQIAWAASAPAAGVPSPEGPKPAIPAAEPPAAMPAAGPAGQPCGAQAARYGDDKGFGLAAVRAGQVRVDNPLRPLTPEVNEVIEVVIGGKVATVYGPDFTALRRGGTPAAVEAMLGAPIRWRSGLPTLPDPLAIVAENGAPLAELAFRTCEAPPAVQSAPQARKASGRTGPGGKPPKAAQKTPPGFSMPQGAIAE